MLATLTRLHAELEAALADLQALTEGPVPGPAMLAERRLTLIRASFARNRFLEQEAYPWLLAALPAPAAEPIRRLQAEAIEHRLRSSRHVSTWTLEQCLRDWAAYCAAARTMRATMRTRIDAERRLLYPLLPDLDASVAVEARGLAAA